MIVNQPFSIAIAEFTAPWLIEEGKELFIKYPVLQNDAGYLTSLQSHSTSVHTETLIEAPQLVAYLKFQALVFAAKLGYATKGLQVSVPRIWLNELNAGQNIAPHSHYGSHFSGVFYVNMPHGTPGTLFSGFQSRFDRASLEAAVPTAFNSDNWSVGPREGDLFLWESHIKHSVPSGHFDGPRRTVSFEINLLKPNPYSDANKAAGTSKDTSTRIGKVVPQDPVHFNSGRTVGQPLFNESQPNGNEVPPKVIQLNTAPNLSTQQGG